MYQSKCQAVVKILKQSEEVRKIRPMSRDKQVLASCSELPCFVSYSPTKLGQEISLYILTQPILCSFTFLHWECLPHLLFSLWILTCPKPPWATNSLPPQHFIQTSNESLSEPEEREFCEDRDRVLFVEISLLRTQRPWIKESLNEWVWGARGVCKGPNRALRGRDFNVCWYGVNWYSRQEKAKMLASLG